jgi:GNAT superfamily N-acetyltransferase
MHDDYTLRLGVPTVADYVRLRAACGLSPMSTAAAERGLPNSLFAVQVLHAGEAIGMGRVIGDGGCFYQVVDIGVLPAHQGRGLGKRIMAAIAAWLQACCSDTGYVSLIADGEARRLYAQFGFVETAPASVGMAWRRPAG